MKLMGESILVALITGGLTLVGTIITVLMTSRKTAEDMRVSQAIMETRLNSLTEEVRKHNNFADRVPVMEEQIKVINHRIDDLERDAGK